MYGYAHPSLPAYTGTNGLTVSPPQTGMVLSQPNTGLTMSEVDDWMEKKSVGDIKNKWLLLGGAAVAAGLLGFYGHKNRWF